MSRKKVKKVSESQTSPFLDKSRVPESVGSTGTSNRELFLIMAVLSAVTLFMYRGVLSSDFAYYDDESYILDNDNINSGITWGGIKWAFTAVGYSDNWHPLTWLSHMLDVQVFGLNPGGHHLTNLVLHIVATLLLFGFLSYATGQRRLSAIAAAMFAWHPLHVESVAWVAERKDVLSAVFGFSALWSYVWYARLPSLKRYAAAIFLFALGLLAKPMLVTLPFLMLLLDVWPIVRPVQDKRGKALLFLEKLPFFALAVVSAIITIVAQQNALRSFTAYSLSSRLFNAVISYCVYIKQLFWPGELAVLYPFTRPQPLSVFLSAMFMIGISTLLVWAGRKKKFLLTGWLWYLGTLVPVIGIIQVGSQAHADRYTYIPYVGLFVMIVWGINEVRLKLPGTFSLFVKAALVFVCLGMLLKTQKQVEYWKDGITLFSHTIAVTKHNEIAHYNLANLLHQSGRVDEALVHYSESLRINPKKLNALGNLAGVYFQMKQYDKAKEIIEKALALAKATGDTLQVRDIQDNIAVLNRMIDSTKNDSLAVAE